MNKIEDKAIHVARYIPPHSAAIRFHSEKAMMTVSGQIEQPTLEDPYKDGEYDPFNSGGEGP